MLPILHLGSLTIHTWGALVTAGVLLCWVLLLERAGRLGYARGRVLLWVLVAFPIGALAAGGAASLVALARGEHLPLFGPTSSGMTVLGSIAGCLLFSWIYIRLVFREPAGRLLDAVAFTYPLSIAFGRVGCLLNGCCFGRPAPSWVPSLFTISTLRYASDTAAGTRYAGLALRAWNLPLLFVVDALAVLWLSEWLYRNRVRLKLRDGAVFLAVALCDSLGRFAIEFTRDEVAVDGLNVNPWQGITLVLALMALCEGVRRQWMQRSAASAS